MRFFFRIIKIKPKHWSDINWIDVTNNLYPGASSKVIVTLFHWWITSRVPTEIKKNVQGNLILIQTLININNLNFFNF